MNRHDDMLIGVVELVKGISDVKLIHSPSGWCENVLKVVAGIMPYRMGVC